MRLYTRLPLRHLSPLAPRRASLNVRAAHDVIVVGLGAMGSSAVYHAAQSSLKVLGIEQFNLGHSYGSSHGHTRVFRHCHRRYLPYIPLAVRAGKLWEELEEDSHQKLLYRCGTLSIGVETAEEAAALKEGKLEHQILTVPELRQLYPGFHVEDESTPLLLDSRGGFLDSSAINETHIKLAQKMNAEIHVGEKMLNWMPDGSGVKVETNRNTYYAQALVLSVGPWIAQHVPQLKPVLQVERQVTGYFNSKPAEHFSYESLPAFIGSDSVGGAYYGIPAYGTQGMKIAEFRHLKQTVNPDSVSRNVTPEDHSVLSKSLKIFFRPEQHQLSETSVCLFTNAPDSKFIIDKHPIHPQVLVCSPCSGMGFKFSSAIGHLVTSMVVEEVDHEVQSLLPYFSLHRDALQEMTPFE